MNYSPIADGLLVIIFAGFLIAAAFSDVRRYTIPNNFCLFIAILFPVHVLASAGLVAPTYWLTHIAAGAGIFAVGTALFATGFFGGGDVKLLSAAALWAGPEGLAGLLVIMSLSGAVLSAVYLVRHRLDRRAKNSDIKSIKIPYGVAIAAGGLVIAANHLSVISHSWSTNHVA